MKLKDIKPNEGNPRQIQKAKLEKLAKSIEEFPKMMELRPIVVDTDGVILGGNMRYQAIKYLKMKEIPDTWVKVAQELSKEEQERFIIEDNVSFGEWDFDILANQWDPDSLLDWGLDIPNFASGPNEGLTDDDALPEAPKIAKTKPGDIYLLDGHRLLCGDATNDKDIKILMGKELAKCVVTDPPYNTGMSKNKDEKAWLSHMFNDKFTDSEWEVFLRNTFRNYDLYTEKNCAIYVFIDWRRLADIKTSLEKISDVKNVLIWDKHVHGLGSDYKSTYENIVVGKKGKPIIDNRYELEYQDIWRYQRSMGRNNDHATQKPVEIMGRPIKHASKKGDIILDLFLGSGTTLIAAEQLDRRCFGMEIDPIYCDVIVKRWEEFTGKKAKKA